MGSEHSGVYLLITKLFQRAMQKRKKREKSSLISSPVAAKGDLSTPKYIPQITPVSFQQNKN